MIGVLVLRVMFNSILTRFFGRHVAIGNGQGSRVGLRPHFFQHSLRTKGVGHRVTKYFILSIARRVNSHHVLFGTLASGIRQSGTFGSIVRDGYRSWSHISTLKDRRNVGHFTFCGRLTNFFVVLRVILFGDDLSLVLL